MALSILQKNKNQLNWFHYVGAGSEPFSLAVQLSYIVMAATCTLAPLPKSWWCFVIWWLQLNNTSWDSSFKSGCSHMLDSIEFEVKSYFDSAFFFFITILVWCWLTQPTNKHRNTKKKIQLDWILYIWPVMAVPALGFISLHICIHKKRKK